MLASAINTETELSDLLSAYLMGWKTLKDCAEWLSGIDWNQVGGDSELAATLGHLDLLCTEASEGLRPESDFERKASQVATAISCRASPSGTCTWYAVPRSETTSDSSSTTMPTITLGLS